MGVDLHESSSGEIGSASGKTPIRVRGKRNSTKDEKWHAGKQRRHLRSGPSSRASSVTLSRASSVASHRTKRRRRPLSRLEELPTEMVQAIFVQSGNLDLPLASRSLAAQLSGKQLQSELTVYALAPIIHRTNDDAASPLALSSAARLLNSRFMTWEFFRQWLLSQTNEGGASRQPMSQSDDSDGGRYADIWTSLQLSPGFMPPAKVLRGPWTEDRINFLRVFSLHPGGCTAPLDGVIAEVAHDGLVDAVQEASMDAIKMMRNLHVQPDQELLRKAIIDFGCNRDVVLYLLHWCVSELMRWTAGPVNRETFHPRIVIDFLDPTLWSWAHRAQTSGDSTGGWLTKTLKRVSGVIADDEDTPGADLLDRVSTHSYN